MVPRSNSIPPSGLWVTVVLKESPPKVLVVVVEKSPLSLRLLSNVICALAIPEINNPSINNFIESPTYRYRLLFHEWFCDQGHVENPDVGGEEFQPFHIE